MKEEYEHYKSIRIIEYVMVIIVLLIVLIIVVPSLLKIIDNVNQNASITSTKGTVDTVKAIYTDMNLTNEVALPFKAVFNKDGYTLYENGKKVKYKIIFNIKFDGKLPTDGSITINTDGTITVKNLTFGSFKCNQTPNKELTCEKR